MKNGSNFDVDYENWKKEKACKLQEIVIASFLSTMDGTSTAELVMHNIFRELLLAAGHTEATLTLFEDLHRGIDHAS